MTGDGPGVGRAGALVTAVLVCAGVTSGCATGQREVDANAAAAGFLVAMSDGDTRGACGLLATDTREDLATSEGTSCPAALESVDITGGKIDEVTVWGDRARARASTGTLFLVELASGWRVAAAGCTRADDGTYDCLLAA
jgi:hypothetical protein